MSSFTFSFSWPEWALLAFGALVIGVSKTGLGGLGILGVALFAMVIPAKTSTGAVLPVLICADIVAVTAFRRHANWSHLARLLPWAGAGVVGGAASLEYLNDRQVSVLIGGMLVFLTVFQFIRRRQAAGGDNNDDRVPHTRLFAATMGLAAGFSTMTANAAGPIMILYLLAAGLPKMEFIGTGAWFFLVINLFKVPFSVGQHLITGRSLTFDAHLAAFAVVGALWGRWLIGFVNQRLFETLALLGALLSGLKMIGLFDLVAHLFG